MGTIPAEYNRTIPAEYNRGKLMNAITAQDGTQIYCKDWGEGQPVVFSHDWPLNADAWASQMVFLAQNGYRAIAHDRRGHGHLSQPSGGSEDIRPKAFAEYVRCLREPETIYATCDDYRAGATLDYEHDADDREAGRRIECPVLVLWGARGFLEGHYDVLDVWRGWADDVQGRVPDSGQYIPDEAPEETLSEVQALFGEGDPR